MATGTRVDAKSLQTDEKAGICEGLRIEETDTRCCWVIDAYSRNMKSAKLLTVNREPLNVEQKKTIES